MRIMREIRFNIGDVVENKTGSRGIVYTTERIEAQKKANSVFSEICVSEYSRDDVFGVEWFQDKQTSFLLEEKLSLCPGMTYASLCYECNDRFSCWTLRRK